MAKRSGSSTIMGAVIGGGTFAAFLLFITPASPLIALLAGAGALVGTMLVTAPKPVTPIQLQEAGVTQDMMRQALSLGHSKLRTLRSYAARMDRYSVKRKAEAVCAVVQKILDDIKQDPRDLKPSRQFLDYYLDTTITIFQRYVELSAHGNLSAEVKGTLIKVENSIDEIRIAFEKHLAKLLENDVLNLDTELKVLKTTLQMEGLGQEPGTVAPPPPPDQSESAYDSDPIESELQRIKNQLKDGKSE